MKFPETLLMVLGKSAEFIADLFLPEEARIKRLSSMDSAVLHSLLPNSPVRARDTFVLFDYRNNAVKLIVQSIKYKNNSSLRKMVASYLCDEVTEMSADISLFDGKEPILIPMPMSKQEKRRRGFNQCEELCKEIGKMNRSNIEISYNCLRKIRETARQTKLGKEERILNVKNSMLAENKIANKRTIIVLDDVYTTGSTLEEARRALRAAGAKRVIGLFIAH